MSFVSFPILTASVESQAAALRTAMEVYSKSEVEALIAQYLTQPTDTEVQSYLASVGGLNQSRSNAVSDFFSGLTEIGIRSSFLDGACYRSDTQASGGTVARSLRQRSNANVPAGSFEKNGVWLQNQMMRFGVPLHNGQRTLIICTSFDRWNTSALAGVMALANSVYQNNYISYYNTGASSENINVSFYGGTGISAQSGSGLYIRDQNLAYTVARDNNLGAGVAASIMHECRSNGVVRNKFSLAGQASHELDFLTFGGDASKYYHQLISGWFIFSSALTDQQLTSFYALLDRTLIPRWNLVFEGDSISENVQNGLRAGVAFRGANIIQNTVHTGGETAANGVAQLGTASGLNDSNLNGYGFPVIVEIGFGANDLGNFTSAQRSVEAIHADLRAMWDYAKARGAKVIARNVMPRSWGVGGDREADRVALNALIAADQGTFYDVLVDASAWAFSATANPNPSLDTNLFRDQVHLALGQNQGAEQLSRYMSTQVLAAGILP